MKVKKLSILIATTVLMAAGNNVNAANDVFFDPAAIAINVGDTFSLTLKGQDFVTGLDGGSFDLFFNTAVLQADSVTVDSSTWNFIATPGSIDNINGKIEYTDFAQIGSNTINTLFNFATFSFTAIGSGDSAISLAVNSAGPFSSNAIEISPNFSAPTVTVQPVPVPGAILLFGTGLISLLGFNRRNVEV